MMQSKFKTACLMAGALLASVPGVATAQETTELEQMRAEMAQMRAEMAQFKADNQGEWVNDARRAEIEGMIADVFADANNRATLLQEGALAGIDEKGKVFLLSADGSFSANFNGQIQARYILNSLDNRAGGDETISGIQLRRVKFGVKGKVADGWGYAIKFAGDRDQENGTNDVEIEDAYISRKVGDNLSVTVGAKKLPFARQELISSSRQVGVDRALATEFFTLGRSDLVELKYTVSDDVFVTAAISDGGNAYLNDFNTNTARDFAVTGRVDWQAIGDNWKAAKHEFGGVDEDALFVGAAAHYEQGDGTTIPESQFAWTVDALYKTGALGLTAAVFGAHTDGPAGTVDRDQIGLYVQGNVDLGNDWDVFGRWDYIDDDGASLAANTEELGAFTFGVNHHFSSNVKFTGDVVWIYTDGAVSSAGILGGAQFSDGLGLTNPGTANTEDQIALRLQLQLLF